MDKIIELIKERCNNPKFEIYNGERIPFESTCQFRFVALNNNELLLPNYLRDLAKFWMLVDRLELFKDTKYGQWGLEIVSYEESINLTHKEKQSLAYDFKDTDWVIGRFVGDSDLLIVAANNIDGYGKIMVAQPIDKRKTWPLIANDFKEFLYKYLKVQGNKYWE